jgi:hypothetical protein
MVVKLTLRKNSGSFAQGEYGTVFLFPDENRAIKVYVKNHNFNADHSRKTYLSETEALKTANENEILSGLTAKNYGPVQIEKIEDENGADITDKYFTDLNFSMEYIEGRFQKMGTVESNERERIISLFVDAGINHVNDACAILVEGKVTKIVDFEMEAIELYH